MELLDKYADIKRQICEYFGYTEDYVVIPIEDRREYFWNITGEGYGDVVKYHENRDVLFTDNRYEDSIYTQRFLKKWVYRGNEFTMICVDTHVDGNKLLAIFDNSKEVKEQRPEKTFTTIKDSYQFKINCKKTSRHIS